MNLVSYCIGLIKNRRRFPRIKNRNLIKSAEEGSWVSNLSDLSEGGIQFLFPQRLEPQQTLDVIINLAEKNKQIPVRIKIAWTRLIRSDQTFYKVGARFLEMGQEDCFTLRRLTASHSLN